MVARLQLYDHLADLFCYPEGEYVPRLDRCLDAMEDSYPVAADALRPLPDHVRGMSIEEIQELYTRTFDINPVCSLEVGWHIYGEDYARGSLLVKMRQMLREHNLPESTELPDHLTHVLALLGRLAGDEADELAGRYVLPALAKMIDGMSDKKNPYMAIVQAVEKVVQTDHDVQAMAPRQPRADPPGLTTPLPVYGRPARNRT